MDHDKSGYVYILANKVAGTLYVGVTSDLIGRICKHREKIYPGFTRRHNVDKLVYYEVFGLIVDAIAREKQLKKWKRQWKIQLIEQTNPDWNDLFVDLVG